MFQGKPFFGRIEERVLVTHAEVPEWMQCTAQTKRRTRCGNLLDYGQMNTFSWLPVKGGFVMGFDYDRDVEVSELGRRYLEQRCKLHFDTGAPGAVDPEWEPFDPAAYREKIVSAARALAVDDRTWELDDDGWPGEPV